MYDQEYYKGLSKKQLRAEIEQLHRDCKIIMDESVRRLGQVNALKLEVERLSLTPEVKADIEAAFERGHQAARRALRMWAVSAIADLENRLSNGEVKPAIDHSLILRVENEEVAK